MFSRKTKKKILSAKSRKLENLETFLNQNYSIKCDDITSKCGLLHGCICDFGDNGIFLENNEALWNKYNSMTKAYGKRYFDTFVL